MSVQVYPVPFVAEPEELSQAIRDFVAPDTWDVVGGGGSVTTFNRALVIRHSNMAHEDIGQFLRAYKQALNAPVEGESLDPVDSSEPSEAIRKALDAPSPLAYPDLPLVDVIDAVAATHHIPFIIDRNGLDDFGIGTDAPVTVVGQEVPLRVALNRILDPLSLTWYVDHEMIIVTPVGSDRLDRHTTFFRVPAYSLDAKWSNIADHGDGSLPDLIEQIVAPDSWTSQGGTGVVKLLNAGTILAVRNTREVREQVQELLQQLAASAVSDNAANPDSVPTDLSTREPSMSFMAFEIQVERFPMKEVVSLVMHELGQQSLGNSPAYVVSAGNKLCVRQTPANLKRIRDLLNSVQILADGNNGPASGQPTTGGFFHLPYVDPRLGRLP